MNGLRHGILAATILVLILAAPIDASSQGARKLADTFEERYPPQKIQRPSPLSRLQCRPMPIAITHNKIAPQKQTNITYQTHAKIALEMTRSLRKA